MTREYRKMSVAMCTKASPTGSSRPRKAVGAADGCAKDMPDVVHPDASLPSRQNSPLSSLAGELDTECYTRGDRDTTATGPLYPFLFLTPHHSFLSLFLFALFGPGFATLLSIKTHRRLRNTRILPRLIEHNI